MSQSCITRGQRCKRRANEYAYHAHEYAEQGKHSILNSEYADQASYPPLKPVNMLIKPATRSLKPVNIIMK